MSGHQFPRSSRICRKADLRKSFPKAFAGVPGTSVRWSMKRVVTRVVWGSLSVARSVTQSFETVSRGGCGKSFAGTLYGSRTQGSDSDSPSRLLRSRFSEVETGSHRSDLPFRRTLPKGPDDGSGDWRSTSRESESACERLSGTDPLLSQRDLPLLPPLCRQADVQLLCGGRDSGPRSFARSLPHPSPVVSLPPLFPWRVRPGSGASLQILK